MSSIDWLWDVISYTLLLVLRQYRFKKVIPVTHELNHVEFGYGDSGYANELIKLLKIEKEPRLMDLGKYICDIASGYLA